MGTLIYANICPRLYREHHASNWYTEKICPRLFHLKIIADSVNFVAE